MTDDEFDPMKEHTLFDGEPDTGDDLVDEGEDLVDGADEGEPDEVAELRQRLDAMEQERKAEQDRHQMQMMQMMSSRPGVTQSQEQAASDAGVSLDDLPDPVEKPAEFKQALAKTLQSVQDQAYQRFSQQSQQEQQYTNLENQFRNQHPDLAGRTSLLRAATADVASELRSQGIDARMMASASPDSFLAKVAERMRSEITAAQDGGEDNQRGKGNRTRGVSAGSRRAANGKRKSGDAEPVSFVDQLKQEQLANGLI